MSLVRVGLAVIAAAGTAVLGLAPGSAAQEAAAQEAADRPGVVLVGVPGLAWPDVTPTDMPTLFQLAGTEAAASLTVRTIRSRTCTVDGWLTVGAGRRATDLTDTVGDGAGDRFCRQPPVVDARPDGGGVVSGWASLVNAQEAQDYGTEIGLLGSRLAKAGVCSTAVGRGAALALADRSGVVDSYLPDVDQLTAEHVTECPLTVVDLGGLPFSEPPPDEEADAYLDPRRAAAADVDETIAALLEMIPDDVALLVVGVADSAPAPRPAEDEPLQIAPSGLRVAVAAGPTEAGEPFGPNWLSSRSTRWTGLVQITDIHATLAGYAGLEPPAAGTVGGQWRVEGPHPSTATQTVAQLVGTDRATQVFRTQSGPFFQILGVAQVLFFLGALLWLRFRPTQRSGVLRGVQYVVLAVAAFPVASFLANFSRWWRSERAGTVLWLTIFAIALAVAVLVLAGPWRRRVYGPPGVLAGLTAAVLAVDVTAGGNLQHTSLLGLSPVVAGRFYGFGNIAFAIFAAASLVAASALAQWLLDRGHVRRTATVATAIVGATVVVTMGAPWAGTNFGGTLSTLPGFALLMIGVSGARVTLPKLAIAGIGAAVLVTLVAWLDWLRPAGSRTHFGEFFADLLDGEALTVAVRKARASLGTLQRAPYYGWLVPVAYAVIAVLVRGGGVRAMRDLYARWPVVRYTIWAGLLTGAIGFATNDSGIIIPAMLLTTGIPMVVTAVTHARRLAVEHPASPAPGPRAATADPGAAERASRSR
ncbi:MAG TPA: hypothetical protein VK925_07985 [Jiangellaceae bacterium]|nr:hypothetical protein [Jiangellaceae bacterium]